MAKFNYEKLGGIEETSRETRQTFIPYVYILEEIVFIHGVKFECKSIALDYKMKRID